MIARDCGHRPGMGQLWLVRHAESEGNVADVRARDARAERLELDVRDPDVPLSRVGREQATALGRSWCRLPDRHPTRVLSSPYERAYRTACLAVEAAGWPLEVERDERLRERDLGLLDGYTWFGIQARFPEEAQRRARLGKFYYRPPGGESWTDVAGRARAVLEANPPRHGQRLVVMTHQAVVMVIRYVLERLTEEQILAIDRAEGVANTAVTTYDEQGGRLRLRRAGDASHLEASPAPRTVEPPRAG